jgi:5-deoxy-glucuronate isomerase
MASFKSGETLTRLTLNNKHHPLDSDGKEIAVILLSGVLNIKDTQLSRSDVFSDEAQGFIFANDGYLTIQSQGLAELAVITCKSQNHISLSVLNKDSFIINEAGSDNYKRSVKQIVNKHCGSTNLIIGETTKDSGNWSSWPPHKHDENILGTETKQKEIYLYKFEKSNGFGIQIIYGDEESEKTYFIRNNDEVLIESGYHPVVTSPHSKMYYLWALFGDNSDFKVNFDTRFIQ